MVLGKKDKLSFARTYYWKAQEKEKRSNSSKTCVKPRKNRSRKTPASMSIFCSNRKTLRGDCGISDRWYDERMPWALQAHIVEKRWKGKTIPEQLCDLHKIEKMMAAENTYRDICSNKKTLPGSGVEYQIDGTKKTRTLWALQGRIIESNRKRRPVKQIHDPREAEKKWQLKNACFYPDICSNKELLREAMLSTKQMTPGRMIICALQGRIIE